MTVSSRRPRRWAAPAPIWAALALAGCSAPPQTPVETAPGPAPIVGELDADARRWVDETLASFDLHDLVAQLVIEWIPGGYTSPTSPDLEPIEHWVSDDHIGGLSPSIGLPHAYVAKLNALQARARVPLLVAADFENGGPGMRINGAYALPSMLPQGGGTSFPPTMAFGAIGDERFAFEYGRITAEEARASGVHLLFAPVLDVNSNPDNPVIATRSFGGDPELVARMGAAFVRGAHAGGAFATGKHFPGHGDTSVDSHTGIPVIEADRDRLDHLELVPFERAIDQGVDAIMTAHVQLPELLGPWAPPATLSPEVLTDLLRDDLGFHGLLLTDALTMRGITDAYSIGEAAVRAVEAGADVILSPKDVPAAVGAVVDAVERGRLTRERLEVSARRILEMKARLGLQKNRYVSLERVSEVVGSGAHLAFADTAAARSMTLVRDDDSLVPIPLGVYERVAHIRYAGSTQLWADRSFSAGLIDRVPDVAEVRLDERSDSAEYARAYESLEGADRVVFTAYVSPSAGSRENAVPKRLRELVATSVEEHPTILVSFGSPYLLAAFPTVGTYLIGWGDREVSQRAAVAALFGEEAISGRLPVALPSGYGVGDGLDRPKVAPRLAERTVDDPLVAAGIVGRAGAWVPGSIQDVADPASVGMSAAGLARVDSIVRAALADSAASGAALAIGRHGKLVDLKGFGELAWGSGRPATPTSLWDLASLSKVVGTTTGAMILYEEGRLDLDALVVDYLPWWARGDERKATVTVRQLLLHRAGLPAFRRWFFDHSGRQEYQDAVADEPLENDPGTTTVYSDISIITLGWIIEQISGQPLDEFLTERVFEPLGMLQTMYNPPATLKSRIAATELDTLWRNELVWGRVHDENADAMGGVAGHAGLFSTAVDLSVFARTLLAGGTAPACRPGTQAGEPCPVPRAEPVRVIGPDVLGMFTTRYDTESSRALGWDTPTPNSSGGDYVTARAFGHTGFTGTSIWMDPELDLWVILLTNRVHPTRDNQKHIPLRRAVADAAVQSITDRSVRRRGR